MKKRHILWQILKITNVNKIVIGFVIYTCLTAFMLMLFDPGVNTFGEGLWYCFSVFSTVGFGDVIAQTTLGRILTIVFGIYSMFVVALVPAVVVNYFQEYSKLKRDESVAAYLDRLENLPNLSHEELIELSEKIKKWRVK